MNILILSAGTRNKIIQYFKNALNEKGKVIATDCSDIAPAIYEADKYYIVPRMTAPGYLEVILNICRKEKIDGVLSLIDPELSFLAQNAEHFKNVGATIIGSSYELCELSLDKMQMFNWLISHNYLCAKSYLSLNDFNEDYKNKKIDFPVFVKPYRGSARVDDIETLELLCKNNDELMIQEFLNGQEIGADVYIDMISGEVVSIFAKKKLRMRAGETDKAVSFIDLKLFDFIKKFVEEAGYIGQIDIDIFEIDGRYYISEVNPRFGGGYPHAYESGIDHMNLIINNLNGIANVANIGNYDPNIYMMKYNEIMIKKD